MCSRRLCDVQSLAVARSALEPVVAGCGHVAATVGVLLEVDRDAQHQPGYTAGCCGVLPIAYTVLQRQPVFCWLQGGQKLTGWPYTAIKRTRLSEVYGTAATRRQPG
jgi:hypothetical protein